MTKPPHSDDPFLEREQSRYENPIPSREYITETLQAYGKPCPLKKLIQLLDLSDDDAIEALRRRCKAMKRDKEIAENKSGHYYVIDRGELLAGKVLSHKDGFGFIHHPDRAEDIFVNFHEMRKVFDGDEVLVQVTNEKRNGKLEGEIVEVTKRNTERIVGKLFKEGKKDRVVPNNPKLQHTIFIDQDYEIAAEHEQIVVVDITRQPEPYRSPGGCIVEVLGNEMDPGMEIDIAIRTHEIPYEWPEAVMEEAERLDDNPVESDKNNRIDIRQLPLVTIDGEDARDFDDAVYCEKKKGGGWRLWVAIADVSHYVQLGSALDEEAYKRATSVYFPENVIPMLPEALSNGLCSLKPEVDRLCMVCEMTISSNGRLSGYEFYEGVMHSHARLTYTEVGKMLNEKDDPKSLVRQHYAHLTKPIDELHNLYQALKGQRAIRGAIEFETTETKIVFDAQRKIETIVPIERNDAHKLIEECMLCANVATARFIQKYKIPGLFRSHEGPTEKKLHNLRSFLQEMGLHLDGEEEPTPQDYSKLYQLIGERPDAGIIQTMMLRSMSQAVYEPENKGHFGLSYPAYTHFTSPIRRYPDLSIHRAIRHVIRSEMECANVRRVDTQSTLDKKHIYPYDMSHLVVMGEHCSMAERRADDATRDVSNWLKCEYLRQHIGDQFSGMITAVAGFGFFVELDNLFAEGMVHVSQLGGDYYRFDAGKQRLVGEKSHSIYKIGDPIEVIVSRVDLEDRKVHLELVNPPGGSSGKPSRKSSGKPSRKASGKFSKDKKSKRSDTKGKKSKKVGKKKGAGKSASRAKKRR